MSRLSSPVIWTARAETKARILHQRGSTSTLKSREVINGSSPRDHSSFASVPMTNIVQPTMPSKEDLTNLAQHIASLPQSRPSLSTRPSYSVPSTPLSHTRKNSFGARSPSPQSTIRNGSPRSTYTALNNGVRSKAPSFTGCRFETGMAFSRRRIPYSIGGDQLERAKAPPKKFLNTDQERKLRVDMRALYNRILPTKTSEHHRTLFVQKLDRILNGQWPGCEIQVHVFGSSGNLLCTSDSDGKRRCCITLMYSLTNLKSRYMHYHKHESTREGVHAGSSTSRAYVTQSRPAV